MQLVSVIIPCYKDSATLARAILSVQHQSYSAIEIVVVNDCSPETVEIEHVLSQFPDVKYLKNNVNQGLAATRNNGLQAAKGEIVAFLDADDEYHKDKITVQVAALLPHSAVTCNLINVYPNGKQVHRATKNRIFNTPGLMLYRNMLNGAGLLTHRQLLLDVGGYDSTLKSCEDYDLWLRLLSRGISVTKIGQPLYIYYYNPAGLSKNFRNISAWELEVISRYAARANASWKKSMHYASVVVCALFKHLIRSYKTRDNTLETQTISNFKLLNGFPITLYVCQLIAYTKVLNIFSISLKSSSK